MTDLTHIESLGIELPKGRYARRLFTDDGLGIDLTGHQVHLVLDGFDELLAVIERLVASHAEALRLERGQFQRAEQASADLAAMTTERDEARSRALSVEDEYKARCVETQTEWRAELDRRKEVEKYATACDKENEQLRAELAAMTKREKVAAMFGDAFEDAAKGCHWMLEYERGLNHVIVSNWQYASQADEAFSDGYEAARMDAEEQYEPRLAAAREDFAEVAKVLDGHCESCAKPYMALLSRYQPEEVANGYLAREKSLREELAEVKRDRDRWEWVATHEPDNQTGLARAELAIRSGNYVEWLLACYQPGGE